MNKLFIKPEILTVSGQSFNFLNPENNTYEIRDIAHALSHLCRFSGHTRSLYSVAQHSVYVSRVLKTLRPDSQLAGLLHDSAEAYIGDIVAPMKQFLPQFLAIEQGIEAALFAAFKLPFPMPPEVKQADLIVLATEQRDLLPEHINDWALTVGITPLDEIIVPWPSETAAAAFLERYAELQSS